MRATVARAKPRNSTFWPGRSISDTSMSALMIEIVVLPDPGPPLTSKWPSWARMPFFLSERSNKIFRAPDVCFRRWRRRPGFISLGFVLLGCRRLAQLPQFPAGVANPFGGFGFVALREKLREPAITLCPPKEFRYHTK